MRDALSVGMGDRGAACDWPADLRSIGRMTDMCGRRPATFVLLFVGFATIAMAQDRPREIDSLEAFSRLSVTYYRDPHPELIASSIAFLQKTGFPQDQGQVTPLIGFYAEIFASNREQLPAWTAQISKTTGQTNSTLIAALKYAQDLGSITRVKPEEANPSSNDMCWGAYFASGKDQYIRALVGRLAYLSERQSLTLFLTAASAQWSLCSNAEQHVAVRRTLEKELAAVPPNIQRALEALLTKSPVEIQESMEAVLHAQHEKKIW
jgi:hypothetical protein